MITLILVPTCLLDADVLSLFLSLRAKDNYRSYDLCSNKTFFHLYGI